MHVSQLIEGYQRSPPPNQSTCEPHARRSSLAVVTGFLNAALRMWDEDRVKAKSRIKIAAAILRDYGDDMPTDTRDGVGASGACRLAPWQARKVKELIDASLDSTIMLQDCASKARLSVSHFSRAFKATFGSTVCDYVRRRRVEQAQQLMLLTKDPLSQIALACGFADQSHYCRVFRDVTGVSPSAWRRRNMTLAPGE